MLIHTDSNKSFFTSRLFLFMAGFLMLTVTFMVWKFYEQTKLTELASNTGALARAYASESQSQFQSIEDALERMAKTEALRGKKDLVDWEKDAAIYTNIYEGLTTIVWVNAEFEIQSIVPKEENAQYLDQNLGNFKTADHEIDLIIPIDSGSEIKGFIFAIIDIEPFFSPVVADIQNEYMLQISMEGIPIYHSPEWDASQERFVAKQLIVIKDAGIWNLSLAPTDNNIALEKRDARLILFFGLLLSWIAFIAIYLAQKYNVVSQVSELRFQKALEGMMEGCQIIDPDWRCLFANDTAAAQLRTKKEYMIGRPIQEFFSGIEEHDLFQHLQHCLNNQKTKQIVESFEFSEGGTEWYEMNIVPAPDGLFILSYDITDQMQMALRLEEERNLLALRVKERTAELSRANKALLKALQTKDEFLATMSHELRTPLTSIMGLSEILEIGARGPLNENQLRAVQTIYHSGSHLLSLINDILDLAKVEAGKLEIAPEEVLVDDVCQASLSLIKGMAYTKDHNLSYKLEHPELKVWADTRRLKQILVNLLSNAVKFTPEGGEIKLIIQPERETGRLLFIVEDNGIGIPDEEKGKLFQAFTQIDGSLSREREGSGLGLALARELAQLHQGDIYLESEGISGKGSRFTVWLPWDHAAQEESLQETPTQQQNRENQISIKERDTLQRNHHRILIAEDNPANLEILRDFLKSEGYQVTIAQDGKQAIDQTLEHTPHLILMDIQMPQMDGLTAIRRLRADERTKHTIIYALTALAMPGDRERCLQAGADDYITKPIKFRELLEKISAQFKGDGEI